jgi:predicted nucleic acid-binding protein
MYLIDTNIFLEVLLDQERAEECQELFERLRDGRITAYVSSFSLHSIEVILERANLHETLIDFLNDIRDAKGIRRFDTNTMEELEAVKLSKDIKLDFDDSIQYYICKTHGLKIVSFDGHFDLTEIERVEPSDVIAEENKKD